MLLKNDPGMWNTLLNRDNDVHSDMVALSRMKKVKKMLLSLGRSNGILLNIGAGQGYLEQVTHGSREFFLHWLSMDISIKGLLKLHAKYSGVVPLLSDATSIALSSNSVNVLVCLEVLEHFNKKIVSELYSEMHRVLPRKGVAILSVPVFEPAALIDHPVGHFRKYTPNVFLEEVKRNGFSVERVDFVYAYNFRSVLLDKLNTRLSLRRPSVMVLLCRKY